MNSYQTTLVVLAAGLSTRYGRLKQLDPMGPGGEALLDYAVYDAVRSGVRHVVFVIRPEIEPEFTAHIQPMIDAGLDVTFVHQRLDDLPDGFQAPTDRVRPWGTAHAVWATRGVVSGPFGVCNADDFYGARAYALLYDHLTAMPQSDCCLVGYELGRTLSPYGGVSRGIVRADPQGWVHTVEEVVDLHAGEANQVAGLDTTGDALVVSDRTLVSMNLWGFHSSILPRLESLLEDFLAGNPGPKQEFYLSQAVGELVSRGQARCRLLPTGEAWLGVTYLDDRDRVAGSLARRVESASESDPRFAYPASLGRAWNSLMKAP